MESIAHNKIALSRGCSDQQDARTPRKLAVQLQSSGQGKQSEAGELMNAARAIEGRRVELPYSAATAEILARAGIVPDI